MKINAVSFTGKMPNKQAYQKAMAEILGQSDKDYLNLTKKPSVQSHSSKEFMERANEFFINLRQITPRKAKTGESASDNYISIRKMMKCL